MTAVDIKASSDINIIEGHTNLTEPNQNQNQTKQNNREVWQDKIR